MLEHGGLILVQLEPRNALGREASNVTPREEKRWALVGSGGGGGGSGGGSGGGDGGVGSRGGGGSVGTREQIERCLIFRGQQVRKNGCTRTTTFACHHAQQHAHGIQL